MVGLVVDQTDNDVKGLPLLLINDASDWWENVKDTVTTYEEFIDKIRQKNAPKQLNYLLYTEIYSTKQNADKPTKEFVVRKSMLFSLLPAPKHP